MFLDNVTTILLMTPITVKLFECLRLNPVPVLPFIILNINIAGLMTLIGHPPNLLITGNSYISNQNITFLTFTMHTCCGVLVALIQTNCHLRIQHHNIHKLLAPCNNSDEELMAWQQCLDSIKNNYNDKLDTLKMVLIRKIEMLRSEREVFTAFSGCGDDENSFQSTLSQLKKLVRVQRRGKEERFFKHVQAIFPFLIQIHF